jgi:hypothetical protein
MTQMQDVCTALVEGLRGKPKYSEKNSFEKKSCIEK